MTLAPSHARPLLVPLPETVQEHAFRELRVEGTVPSTLQGTLYRNGPGLFGGPGVDHWFDAPGVLTAIRLGQGRAMGAVRVVRTPDVARALQGGRARARYRHAAGLGSRLRALLGLGGTDNLANINVVPWNGQLLALYEGSPATVIDPETLEVKGTFEVAGRKLPLQAHPHRVPSRRTTYHIGLRPGRRSFVDLVAFPDEGEVRRLASVEVPGIGEIHDFFVTERYAVLMLPPLWCGPLDLLRAGFEGGLRWQPELGTELVVIPLDAPEQITRLRAPPAFFWHQANAWDEEEGRIGLEWVGYPDFSTSQQLEGIRQGELAPAQGTLWRGTLSLQGAHFDAQRVLDRSVEFPWVHDGVVGRRHRFTWMGAHSEESGRMGWFDRWLRRDAETGEIVEIDPGPGRAVGEPVVVPGGEDERVGFVLSMVRDSLQGASHLAILDAGHPERGPLARVWFDQPLPHSLHGHWVAAR